jgi:hypothetical protein
VNVAISDQKIMNNFAMYNGIRHNPTKIREFFRIFTTKSKVAHYGDWNNYPMTLCGMERKMYWILYDPESNPNDNTFAELNKIDCKKCRKILDNAGIT